MRMIDVSCPTCDDGKLKGPSGNAWYLCTKGCLVVITAGPHITSPPDHVYLKLMLEDEFELDWSYDWHKEGVLIHMVENNADFWVNYRHLLRDEKICQARLDAIRVMREQIAQT